MKNNGERRRVPSKKCKQSKLGLFNFGKNRTRLWSFSCVARSYAALTTRYEAVTKNIIRTQLEPFDNCLRPLKKNLKGRQQAWSQTGVAYEPSSWNRTGEQWQKNPSPYIVLSALLSENPDPANCLLPIGTRMRSTLYSPLPWCCLYSGKTFWWD